MIKNIIFDMGQVLIRWNPEEMLAAFDLPEADQTEIRRELFTGVEWIQQDRGVLTTAQVAEKVCARLPERLYCVVEDLVFHWHDRFLIPMPGMAELVRDLKNRGYSLYLLSNAGTPLRSYFPRIPGAEYFDGLMVSAEEVLLKPQHEIYERLYERFDLNPAECWFIDDSPANIEGAILTGMQGTIFRGDAAELRNALHQAGIL